LSALNTMPDASHPADSSAIVPAIKYERRMTGSSLRQSKFHQSAPATSGFPRSVDGRWFSSALKTWVKGRERSCACYLRP
jgi:hypothetical protein